MSPCPENCCCTSCPEPTDVVVNYNTFQVDPTNALQMSLANVGGATGVTTVSGQVVDEDGVAVEGNFVIGLFFVDTPDMTAPVSAVAPSTPGWRQHELRTEDDGSFEIELSHDGALDTWYLVASLFSILTISDIINLGS